MIVCRDCGLKTDTPDNIFHIRPTGTYQSYCIECMRLRSRASYLKRNPDRKRKGTWKHYGKGKPKVDLDKIRQRFTHWQQTGVFE